MSDVNIGDGAWFREGDVDLVVERKFSNNLAVYSPYHVQTQLYCLGLGEMGFNNEFYQLQDNSSQVKLS